MKFVNSSLRKQLMVWVLLPLVSVIAVDTWLTYVSSTDTAAVVQDRLLLGSARMIAQQISFEDGSFQHQIPPAALELFQSSEPDHIFYRVTTGTGKLLSGYIDLPLPTATLPAEETLFFSASMRGQSVRVVAFFQPVIGSPSTLPVIVEVAQTTHARTQLTNKLWRHAVGQQLFILLLATICILFGLQRGLQPLIRLRNDVRNRKEGSLQKLQIHNIPSELTPLVDSFNEYMERLEKYTDQRSSFIQTAAHQLRTPLTVLNTQMSDALRAQDKNNADLALMAARKTLQQTVRLVNQFLLLSSAEAFTVELKPMSTKGCCDIVQTVLEELSSLAHSKQIDLGFECSGGDAVISVSSFALKEIAINLVDNAIRYTPAQGVVTVHIESTDESMTLAVEDNGPGVPMESREKIFQRFYRERGVDAMGSGLGLTIVQELAAQCGGKVNVAAACPDGTGLLISVSFPELNSGTTAF
jgi:two-component system sensor histidine kinase TctE